MTDRPQDSELRARFEAQRRDDARHVPSFEQMMARAREDAASLENLIAGPDARSVTTPDVHTATLSGSTARRRIHRRLYRAGALAAAAAIAVVIVTPRMRSGDDAFEQAVRAFQSNPALGAWQSPTDGLLQLPGDGLLTSMPTVGTGPQ